MSESYERFCQIGKLSCPPHCSRCCEEHQVSTTVFEMIPAAEVLYEKGLMEETLELIEKSPPHFCVLLKDQRCRLYEQRPSLCRLFGLGRIENKNEKDSELKFSICKIIKEKNPLQVQNLSKITELKELKTFNQLYMPLYTSIPANESEELPLNLALKKALEKVALYKSYETKEEGP